MRNIIRYTRKVVELISRTPIRKVPGIKPVYRAMNKFIWRIIYTFVPIPEKIEFRGYGLYVDNDSEYAKTLYLSENYIDEWEVEIIDTHLSVGDTAFDVGGFIGTHTIIMRDFVGETGEVYTFEPQPECADMIRKTVEENGFENCEIVEKAVDDTDGKTRLHTAKDMDTTANIIDSDPWQKHTISTAVETIQLKSFLQGRNIETVHFMKIDVQGAELAVLRGIGDRIEDVGAILIELHSKYMEKRVKEVTEIFKLLNERGIVYRVDSGEKVQVTDSEEILFEQKHPHILWINGRNRNIQRR